MSRPPSCASVTGRKLARPDTGSSGHGNARSDGLSSPERPQLVTFILLAEFDIEEGSVIRHQYPRPTGCDDHLLAELMLPDGAHLRSEDWTVFQLNQTEATAVVDAADERTETLGDADVPPPPVSLKPGQRPLLHAMSLVRTKKDASAKRGALCKALAICSPQPYIQIFKPLLLLCLENYFSDESIGCLARLYEAINTVELARLPVLSRAEAMILRTSERKDLFDERFADVGGPGEETVEPLDDRRSTRSGRSASEATSSRKGSASSHDDRSPMDYAYPRQGSVSLSGHLQPGAIPPLPYSGGRMRPRDTHFFDATVDYSGISVPVRIPIGTPADDVGDYSLIRLIQTFSSPGALLPLPTPLLPHLHTGGPQTHPIIFLFNALVSGLRVVFLGANMPAGQVSEYVLAACALASGCGSVLTGFAERAFPYSNLVNIDSHELNPSGPAYIAGVTNPRFEYLTSRWDVLCNIETGKISLSKDTRPPSPRHARPFSPTPSSNAALSLDPPSVPSSAVSGQMPFGRHGDGLASSLGASTSSEVDIGRAPVAPPLVSNPSTASLPTLNGAGPALSKAELGREAYDSIFMEDVMSAIQSHYGEIVIRARFIDYATRFVRIASCLEEASFASSTLGFPSRPFGGNRLGSGPTFPDDANRQRELAASASRVEAWRQTRSCTLHRLAWREMQDASAVPGIDLLHQVNRLRQGRKMPTAEVEAIFRTLATTIRSDEQVEELLALCPTHTGGLMPLAFGLLHQSPATRDACVELFQTLSSHPTGRKFVSSLNSFFVRTFQRLATERPIQPPSVPVRSPSAGL